MIWKGREIGEDGSINVGLDLDSACGEGETVSSCSTASDQVSWSLLIGWSGPMRSSISTVTRRDANRQEQQNEDFVRMVDSADKKILDGLGYVRSDQALSGRW